MREEELDEFDEEEFEMLINGLIHPQDMMMSPDMLAGAFPPPFGAGGGMPGGAPNLSSMDGMIVQAYDEEEEEGLFF